MDQDTKNLVIAFVAGLIGVLLVYSFVDEESKKTKTQFGPIKRVVIARTDLQELKILQDSDLDFVEIPQAFVQPNAVFEKERIIGLVTATPIAAREQILDNKLLQPGADTGIAMQVTPGKRAVTIPVDETRALSKLIRPGDRVDLFVSLEVGRGLQSRRETVVFLSDVPVIATGLNVINQIPRAFEIDPNSQQLLQVPLVGNTRYNTLTVEVGPREAQDLIYILSTAPTSLYLLLRNPADRTPLPRLPASNAEAIATRYGGS